MVIQGSSRLIVLLFQGIARVTPVLVEGMRRSAPILGRWSYWFGCKACLGAATGGRWVASIKADLADEPGREINVMALMGKMLAIVVVSSLVLILVVMALTGKMLAIVVVSSLVLILVWLIAFHRPGHST